MTNPVLFLVVEEAYEYNDEIYTQGDSDGSTPVKLYRTQIAADKVALESNIEFLQDADLNYYGYSLNEVVNVSKLLDIVPQASDIIDYDSDIEEVKWEDVFEIIDDLIAEDRIRAYACFKIQPFKVTSVEIEED